MDKVKNLGDLIKYVQELETRVIALEKKGDA